jgi:threonine/homoserine/homoserine lactone efflux protein
MLELPLTALVGFATAAPTGPVNLICARRALQHGFWPGFSAGLGAAAAESIYAALAVGGLSLASGPRVAHAGPLRTLMGVALLALAAFCWRTAGGEAPTGDASKRAAPRVRASAAGAVGTFAPALSNPVLLLSMGLGLAIARSLTTARGPALLEFLGLVAGLVLWWALLTASLARVRNRVSPAALRRLNRGVAVALAAFGVAALVRSLL